VSERRTKAAAPYVDAQWTLLVFVMGLETIDASDADNHSLVQLVIADIDTNFASSEYTYFRYGFCLIHHGRRGICVSVWHWGDWGGTRELFNRVWYAYNGKSFEPLDSRDPIMCHHEIPLVSSEFQIWKSAVDSSPDLQIIRTRYLEAKRSIPRWEIGGNDHRPG